MTLLPLTIERPVAGGLMLARHEGRVVLVSGAIPGERVMARPGRTTKQMMWASVVEVLEASPSRRDPGPDPACGGLSYAHIIYDRQLELKAQVVADSFRRVGKMTLAHPVTVAPSPEEGYRLRARLHLQKGRIGFFRENTHTLCDAGPTRQLLPESITAAEALILRLGNHADAFEALVIAENVRASERVLHLESRGGARLDELASAVALPEGVTGVSAQNGSRVVTLAGDPRVSDSVEDLCGGGTNLPAALSWARAAASFFQGNRHLAGTLLQRVLAHASGDRVLDLYAGVGLFSAALAARGARVIAVEGDPHGAADLGFNASPWGEHLEVMASSVEEAASGFAAGQFDTIVVDPPRTGLSPEALSAVVRIQASRVVYISCDPATLARDAALLVGGGYQLGAVEAFDMFPTTAHVETLAVFDRTITA